MRSKMLCLSLFCFALFAGAPPVAVKAANDDWMAAAYANKNTVRLEVARQHLELQREAGDIVALSTRIMGDSYAGIWFDRDSGRFKIGYVDDTGSQRASLLLHKSTIGDRIDRVKVATTWEDLLEAKNAIATRAEQVSSTSSLDNATFSISPDVEHNRITVSGPPKVTRLIGDSLTQTAVAPNVTIQFEDEPAEFRPEPDINNCVPFSCGRPLQAGVAINDGSGACTAGIVAKGDWSPLSVWLITAGHCFDLHSTIYAFNRDNGRMRPIGPELGSHFGVWGDFAAIRIDNSNWYTNGISWQNKIAMWFLNDDLPVANVQTPYIGQFTCHTGLNTNMPPEYKCGNVIERHVTLGIPPNPVLGSMTKTDACGGSGDSGGPYVVNFFTAVGIHYGGWNPGGCGPGTSSYFTEIPHIFALLQLSLFT